MYFLKLTQPSIIYFLLYLYNKILIHIQNKCFESVCLKITLKYDMIIKILVYLLTNVFSPYFWENILLNYFIYYFFVYYSFYNYLKDNNKILKLIKFIRYFKKEHEIF